MLAASGVAVADLGEAKQAGLAEGLRQLAAGEVDAVITTIAAPAHSLQRAATDGRGIKLLSIGTQERAILAGAQPDLVPITLPPNTYPGQTGTVETAAVTAILVGTTGLSDATVEALLGEVYGGIDFVRAGSTAGSLISRATAQTGLTLAASPGGGAVPAAFDGHAIGWPDMDDTISDCKATVAAAAVAQGLLGGEVLLAGFVDVGSVRAAVAGLKAGFPDHFTHAFAAKAGCLEGILRLLRTEGMACEVASPGELAQARAAGFTPGQIVFDLPAKTRDEIRLPCRKA